MSCFPLLRTACVGLLLASSGALATEKLLDFRDPPHSYFEHTPTDRLAQLHIALATGQTSIDTSSEQAFLISLLEALEIPQSSQILLFSATSLQSEIIRPRNPRALYFNDDTYVGWVPGGRVEVAAIDPEMGPMFYVYERVQPGRIPEPDRSQKCFNCHAGAATKYVPGLIAESVLVSMAGSSLRTYRHDVQGHQLPLEDRFGGWLLTGDSGVKNSRANRAGESNQGKISEFDVMPGQFYDPATHLRETSDILPHLLHEHQLGFENRLFYLRYLRKQRLHEGGGRLRPEAQEEIADLVAEFARYILFADEAKLPNGGIEVDPEYSEVFQSGRMPDSAGRALKDLDLTSRLFRYRCSYMLYTDSWIETPKELRDQIYYQMAQGLRETGSPPEFSHLPVSERLAIRQILKETLSDLPDWWR